MKSFWFATAVLTLLTEGAPAHAQFGGVVFDPTQSAHAIEQIAQGEQIFTNTVTLAKNATARAEMMTRKPSTSTSATADFLESWDFIFMGGFSRLGLCSISHPER